MTDRKALTDQNETPEDVATLYSWANLHGAKYRDFSASRAQTREKARLRVQAAIDDERRRAGEQAEMQKANEAEEAAASERAAEAARQAELEEQAAALRTEQAAQQTAQYAEMVAAEQARQQAEFQAQQSARQAADLAAQQAARQAANLAAQQSARQAADLAAQQAARQAAQRAEVAAQQAAQQAARQAELVRQQQEQAAQNAVQQAAQQQRDWQRSARPERFSALPAAVAQPAATSYFAPQPPQNDFPGFAQPAAYRPTPPVNAAPPQPAAPAREEGYLQPRSQWAPEPRENPGRPAWLVSDRADVSNQPLPQAPEDTLQGSRDRMTSRWFALKGVFEGGSAPVESAPAPIAARAPVMAVFSLAGGVGKTSLVATLGRALSARGERVLLVDTAAYGLLPFYFGARDQRPGVLRTFSPPGANGDAPIQLVTIDPETLGPEVAGQDALNTAIAKDARGMSRIIIDLATASGATTRRVMRMSPLVLVPVIPDMNSVVSVSSIDAFFQHNTTGAGSQSLPFYVLNQFDPSLPLHLDVREVLREQLGDRLLPFALRRTPAVSEALAEGMTVMDYAPNSTVAEDFGSLAGWVKSQSAPANVSFRGVRWSER